jgi:hypothetical protein
MIGARRASVEGADGTTSGVADALADAHEKWSVEVEEVSGRILTEAEREQFHPNGSSAAALVLDHPEKAGWQVLAPGNSRDRWEALYETDVEAASVLATLTHIFEARRTMKHKRPNSPTLRAYYAVESLLLETLKPHSSPTSVNPKDESA